MAIYFFLIEKVKKMTITFEQVPQAVGQILDRLTRLEAFIGEHLLTEKNEPTPSNGKRIATAEQLAKYLNRPISAIYQMQHRGSIQAMRMPGSRRLYYDLDTIDGLMAKKEVAA